MRVGDWRIWRHGLLKDLLRLDGQESVMLFRCYVVVLCYVGILRGVCRSRGLTHRVSCSY